MTPLIKKAISYSIQAHEGQFYGVRNYSYHLQQVYNVGLLFTDNEDILCSCWLHDTLEDTSIKYKQLQEEFNKEIAEIVFAVTDELGRNRKERKAKTYPKIASNEKAIYVKLFDRIANIKESLRLENGKHLLMYKDEHKDFMQLKNGANAKLRIVFNAYEDLINKH